MAKCQIYLIKQLSIYTRITSMTRINDLMNKSVYTYWMLEYYYLNDVS